MSLYVLGDFHGRSIQEFLREENPEPKDTIVSTGDFDTVEVVDEFLDLKEGRDSERVFDVLGNHDHAMLDRVPLTSSTITSQKSTYKQMVEDLHSDQQALSYFEELLEEKIKTFETGGRKIVVVHGGLAGYLQNPDLKDEIQPLWYRLWEDEDFKENFQKMDEINADITFRGHDHWTEHAYRLKSGDEVDYHLPEPGDTYVLDDNYRHIVTHGPWFDGFYLQVSEEDFKIEFKKI